jgi:helicase
MLPCELPRIIREVLESKKVSSLRPPQELSLKAGVLDKKSLVISSPTSSGKTLVAEFAMIKHFEDKGKTLYVVPLKSLASEKYEDLKDKYSKYGLKTALSIGDLDELDNYLAGYDVIITTSEKADSLLRHNAQFIRGLTCVVIDEVHLIDEASRGPTLEILITRLKELLPNAQFLALSATINNDSEISEWLNASLVKSNYRPVKLYEGVLLDKRLYFKDKEVTLEGKGRDEAAITIDTLKMNKQVFSSSLAGGMLKH